MVHQTAGESMNQPPHGQQNYVKGKIFLESGENVNKKQI